MHNSRCSQKESQKNSDSAQNSALVITGTLQTVIQLEALPQKSYLPPLPTTESDRTGASALYRPAGESMSLQPGIDGLCQISHHHSL